MYLTDLVADYFKKWNDHDGAAVGALFAEQADLQDWNASVSGKEEIQTFNEDLFAACPDIRCEVRNVHVSGQTMTATCEILVHVNKNDTDAIKAVDVITFDNDGKIKNLQAFKQRMVDV